MAALPTYDQWMKDTYSLVRKRSEYLKQLDEAIKTQNKATVKTALDRWRFEQSKEGKDWRKSVRNEKGAVTKLYRVVNELDKRALSKEELEALKYISRAQAMALQKLFLGKKLQFKSNTLVGMANGAGTKWQRFKTGVASLKEGSGTGQDLIDGARGIAQGVGMIRQGGKAVAASSSSITDGIKQSIMDFCQNLCPGLSADAIMAALHLDNVAAFASTLAPFVGAISSGGKALAGWVTVARRYYESVKVEDARYAIKAGDPEAAFDAVIQLIDRDMKSEAGHAATATVGFTGKLLGSFADFGAVTGPVLGMLELLAGIFQTIVEYVRDYKECKAGDEMLRLGALNFELFTVCPILGCYFLVVQDHSTIINFAVGDYGTPNWMFDVERLIKKVALVLAKAQGYIKASRLEIAGMDRAKGVVEMNYSKKTGLDKLTGAPDAIKDKIGDRIDAWFDKPEKPPAVDKSRIVGFGFNQNSGGWAP
jgi:hypothetical protein